MHTMMSLSERRNPSSRRTANRPARALALVLCCAVLAGCSSLETVQRKLGLGSGDDTILPGRREAVITSGAETSPDPDLASTPLAVPAAYTNADWSQPGGVASNALQHVALAPQPQRAWAVDAGVGSSSQGRLTASPIVANGRIFVLDTQATLRAFDAGSGKRLWSKNLAPNAEEEEEGYGGGVASNGRMVFVTTAFGNIMAIEADTGELVWGKRLDSSIRAAPTVADGRIYVVAEGPGMGQTQYANLQRGPKDIAKPPIPDRLELRMQPESVFAGVVRRSDGQPLAGARVAVRIEQGPEIIGKARDGVGPGGNLRASVSA